MSCFPDAYYLAYTAAQNVPSSPHLSLVITNDIYLSKTRRVSVVDTALICSIVCLRLFLCSRRHGGADAYCEAVHPLSLHRLTSALASSALRGFSQTERRCCFFPLRLRCRHILFVGSRRSSPFHFLLTVGSLQRAPAPSAPVWLCSGQILRAFQACSGSLCPAPRDGAAVETRTIFELWLCLGSAFGLLGNFSSRRKWPGGVVAGLW